MPVGRSGRIVVEFDPELKRRLHGRLRSEGRDFKGWLLDRVREYLEAPRAGVEAPRSTEEPTLQLTELERRVLEAVSSDARARHHVDDLVQATGLRIGEVHEALLQLELQGCVLQHQGLYRRVRPS
jgi:predicted Rossmann fold nucleotide-binding protein DprA/Smf involved in DNA uptake